VLGVALATVAGCGGQPRPATPLDWDGTPKVFLVPGLRSDRVLIGRVQNMSERTLRLAAARLVIRDAGGRALAGSVGFTTTYAHGLWGAFQQPSAVPTAELLRLGRAVMLSPGASVPFYAAWRVRPGARPPLRLDYIDGTLTLPALPS
jgi:hypothetical protein